jgi:hypothetical protein
MAIQIFEISSAYSANVPVDTGNINNNKQYGAETAPPPGPPITGAAPNRVRL